ncbi:unnamed protein product [Onchocerca ochengi]|uniref:Uncharacterized protein n=1 Tax=Onchocerca ochengi TaxID=42157 RepID=A0A182EJ33_ONCOC|nr:unnamed protein product [Onchocerca ochengi]
MHPQVWLHIALLPPEPFLVLFARRLMPFFLIIISIIEKLKLCRKETNFHYKKLESIRKIIGNESIGYD